MTDGAPRRLFCSDAARLRGDDSVATVARIDAWILVEYSGPWGRDPIRDASMTPHTRRALQNALRTIPRSRLLFIRRRAGMQQTSTIFVARSRDRAGYAKSVIPNFECIPDVRFEQLHDAPDPSLPPLVLVCTHGQHDSCCGRRGYPLFEAVARLSGIDAWQCSHVGGDRFAANAVVLPWGLFYGRVEAEQANALVESTLSSNVLLASYRGRSTLSRPAQAAEIFLRRELGLLGLDAIRPLGRQDLADGRAIVQMRDAAGRGHRVTVERYIATTAFATCTSKTADPIEQYRVVDHVAVP